MFRIHQTENVAYTTLTWVCAYFHQKIKSYTSAECVPTVTACERLILLEVDSKELRDYSILLYHCGFYEQSLEFVKLYQDTKVGFLYMLNNL